MVGYFNQNNINTVNPAVEVRTISTVTNATAFAAYAAGTKPNSSVAAIRAINYSTNSYGYGILGQHAGAGIGVYGTAAGAGGRGMYARSTATSGKGSGILADSASYDGYGANFVNNGLNADLVGGVALLAQSMGGTISDTHPLYLPEAKAAGEFAGYVGVIAASKTGDSNGTGLTAINNATDSGYGIYVYDHSSGGEGGYFYSNRIGIEAYGTGFGVWGEAAPSGYGVYGLAGAFGYAVYGDDATNGGYAGYFNGIVHATSYTSLASTTLLDDPADSGKYVQQANVVADDMLGMKNGNVTLDKDGTATVILPAWFDQVYSDFRYTLTPLDQFAPLYVAGRMKDGRFKIAGGKPGMEVSWLVSGVRQDKYALEHPLKSTLAKTEIDRPAPNPVKPLPERTPPARPGQTGSK